MSDQQQQQQQPSPVAVALGQHADQLVPGAAEQLASIWSDLAGAPESVAKDAVAHRLTLPQFAHFRRASTTPTAPSHEATPTHTPDGRLIHGALAAAPEQLANHMREAFSRPPGGLGTFRR